MASETSEEKVPEEQQNSEDVVKGWRIKNLSTASDQDGGITSVERCPPISQLSNVSDVVEYFNVYPFRKATSSQIRLLKEYIYAQLETVVDEIPQTVDFYLRLITPRSRLKHNRYGWLHEVHIALGLDLLRLRSEQTATPFKSERIAFLSPLHSHLWINRFSDFKSKGPSKYTFDSWMVELFYGRGPNLKPTDKEWFKDIDFLYVPVNVGNCHWVALEINLNEKAIMVYDSSPKCVTNSDYDNAIKPFSRMIPHLHRSLEPRGKKKRVDLKAFTVKECPEAPTNPQSDDCGVYTLKYIECLAFGCGFSGLNDEAIPEIRLKLAVDIFESFPPDRVRTISDREELVLQDKDELMRLLADTFREYEDIIRD